MIESEIVQGENNNETRLMVIRKGIKQATQPFPRTSMGRQCLHPTRYPDIPPEERIFASCSKLEHGRRTPTGRLCLHPPKKITIAYLTGKMKTSSEQDVVRVLSESICLRGTQKQPLPYKRAQAETPVPVKSATCGAGGGCQLWPPLQGSSGGRWSSR